jgi:hypothetical protein
VKPLSEFSTFVALYPGQTCCGSTASGSLTLGRTFIPISADAGTVKTGDELVDNQVAVPWLDGPVVVVATPVAQSGARVAKRK